MDLTDLWIVPLPTRPQSKIEKTVLSESLQGLGLLGWKKHKKQKGEGTKGERVSLGPVASRGECTVSARESASKTAQETITLCLSKDSKIRVGKKLEELGPLPALHRPSCLSSDHKLCQLSPLSIMLSEQACIAQQALHLLCKRQTPRHHISLLDVYE